MKKISRRSFLMATGTFAAATALTACSGGGSTGKASTAASSAPASSAAASEAADPSKYEVTEPITITKTTLQNKGLVHIRIAPYKVR